MYLFGRGSDMKRTVAMLAAAVMLMLSLTACTGSKIFKSADSLLVPPLFYEEYEGLVELFRSQIGDGASLCSPYDGDYRSAIIVEDFDGDSLDEAIIFYRDSSGDSAKARCYESDGGEWVSSADFNGHGNQVESVSVRDMNGDGISEIIVSWSISGVSTGKTLSIYHSAEASAPFKEISNEVCSVSMIIDVDGDSLDDIFLITSGSTASPNSRAAAPQRFARLISVSNGAAVLKGEARVDANISSYASVKTEKTSDEDTLRIYIDAMKGEHQMITELIYWDSENSELVAPLFDESTMSNARTLRNEPIVSADINGDGKIDVPSQIEIFSSDSNEMTIDPQYMYVTSWLNFHNGGFGVLYDTLVNYADGYMLVINNRERTSLVVEEYPELNCWIVKEKSADGTETELYSILRIPNDKTDTDLEMHVPLIEKDEYTVYAYINRNGTERGITGSELKTKILPLF